MTANRATSAGEVGFALSAAPLATGIAVGTLVVLGSASARWPGLIIAVAILCAGYTVLIRWANWPTSTNPTKASSTDHPETTAAPDTETSADA
jgi:hypothetical protein